MSPIDRIAVAYAQAGMDFAVALERNYQEGFVFATPTYFVMGSERTYEGYGRAWFVEAMAGDMAAVWGILPYPLPWVAFAREGRSGPSGDKGLRLVRIGHLSRVTQYARHVRTPTPA